MFYMHETCLRSELHVQLKCSSSASVHGVSYYTLRTIHGDDNHEAHKQKRDIYHIQQLTASRTV
jgi:hypothetical protein